MIAYCPLEELEPPPPRQQVVVSETKPEKGPLGDEDTELNYVIIAFIVGVIMLAVSDSIMA